MWRTDKRTDWTIHGAAWSQLKKQNQLTLISLHFFSESFDFYYDFSGCFQIRKLESTEYQKGEPKKNPRVRKTHHPCPFCEVYTNISKHIRTHKEEAEIKTIENYHGLLLQTNDKNHRKICKVEVDKIMTRLRLQGDHSHNLRVKHRGYGTLHIARRHSAMEMFNINDFWVCEDCCMWLQTQSNHKEHEKNCIAKNDLEKQ